MGVCVNRIGTEKSSTIDEVTRHTGLLDGMNLTSPGNRDEHGRPLTVDGVAVTPARTAVNPSIAFTYDYADDDARVTLVHSYRGSQKQMQFLRNGDSDAAELFDGQGGARSVEVPLGTNFMVSEGKIDHDGEDDTATVAPQVAGSDFVSAADTSKKATLYYVDSGNEDMTVGVDEDDNGTVEPSEEDDGIDDTKIFLERHLVAGVTSYQLVNVVQVTVDNATGYKHLHYGLWNGLSGSDANTITDLGVGFVTALSSGMGMTDPDHDTDSGMPNFGGATYDGDYVANVQAADEEGDGPIGRFSGTSTVTADFVKDEVGVVLSGLATLEGDISGNTFSGDGKPTLNATLPGGLVNADDFMGSFSGGFFGPSAAEAGGVFDYASKDNKNGAFRGSFGGAR